MYFVTKDDANSWRVVHSENSGYEQQVGSTFPDRSSALAYCQELTRLYRFAQLLGDLYLATQ